MGADYGVRLSRQALGQRFVIPWRGAIPKRDSGVSRKSLSSGTRHRRAAEATLKSVGIHLQERDGIRRFLKAATHEIRIARLPSKTNVPWADVLTDVASINERADGLAELDRD